MIDPIPQDVRDRAVAAAAGRAPFDALITGGRVLDTATLAVRPADVGLVGPLIASVHAPGARRDAGSIHALDGRVLAPGLIDSHCHFESSLMAPADYAACVLPGGTTTSVWDPHELGNVSGIPGVRWAIDSSRGLPLRVLVMAPSCVPSAPGLEVAGAAFGGPELATILSWPEVVGTAEVMDMVGVVGGSAHMRDVVGAGLAAGKPVMGHARGLSGPALQAFAAAGITSDHEITAGEDLLEKLAAGFTVELRGSHDAVLPGAVAALATLPRLPPTLVLCTDDILPDDLLAKGGLRDTIVRLATRGMAPEAAIACATLHAALRLGRRDLGQVAPGRIADLIALDDVAAMTVARVWSRGRLAAVDGRMVVDLPRDLAAAPRGTMHLKPLPEAAFRVPAPGRRARLRAISGARFTKWLEVEVDVQDGAAVVPEDFSVLVSIHRHGRTEAVPRAALIHDWGTFRGAIATTVAHDCHNLLTFGRDPVDMAAAANAVIGAGGGMAVARGGQVVALLPLPIAGLLAETPPERTAQAFAALRAAADQVAEWQPPYRIFRALTGASLACNPGPHLTDLGLTDGSTGAIVSPVLGWAA